MNQKNIVIIGNKGGTNVGTSFYTAALNLNLETCLLDARQAFAGPTWLVRVNWRLRGHRPARLSQFSQTVLEFCRRERPAYLLSTGLAPICSQTLREINRLGTRCLNFLTDDPWNPGFRARWFFKALQQYDFIFTPRLANLEDLTRHARGEVYYLPFAFDPDLFYPDRPNERREPTLRSDVIFAGGADRDRIPYLAAFNGQNVEVAIYGDYWDRYAQTKVYYRGHAAPETLRKATSGAKVAICLVRRANRDGHVMRSFEIPATKTCMLAEDTEEHRLIYGDDLETVAYFRTIPELVDKAQWLLKHDEERRRLAEHAYRRIQEDGHTYQDRLEEMLSRVAL